MCEKYEINFLDPGKVLVFADCLFDRNSKLKYIQNDISLINRVFGSLNFSVETYLDLESDELKNKITQVANDDYTGSCIICIFSTHGDLNFIKTNDGREMSLNEIVNQLTEENTLLNKPKLVFIDATHAANRLEIFPENIFNLDSDLKNDILIEYVSIKNDPIIKNDGSVFIQKLCRSIGLNSDDITSILSNINKDIVSDSTTCLARFVSSLKKKFLFPK